MRGHIAMILAVPAIAAAAPAGAQHWSDASAVAAASVNVHRGPPGDQGGQWRHRRARGDFNGGVVVGVDREWQGDTAWRPTSFNDWWHERPDRAFPRWMQNNQGCERQWWGGGTWRC